MMPGPLVPLTLTSRGTLTLCRAVARLPRTARHSAIAVSAGAGRLTIGQQLLTIAHKLRAVEVGKQHGERPLPAGLWAALPCPPPGVFLLGEDLPPPLTGQALAGAGESFRPCALEAVPRLSTPVVAVPEEAQPFPQHRGGLAPRETDTPRLTVSGNARTVNLAGGRLDH